MTVLPDPAMRDFITDCRIRGHRDETIETRRRILTVLSEHYRKPLLTLTADEIESWYRLYARNPTWTRITYGRSVTAFYQWAQRREHRPDNPAATLPVPKRPQSRPRPIPNEDLTLAIRSAPDSRTRAWLALGAETGLRAGEISRLAGIDIRTSDGAIDVINGKGGRDRTVPAGAQLLALLAPFRSAAGRGRLWEISPQTVTNTLTAFFRGLDMPWTCHNLRHSCATLLYQISEGDLLFVKDVLGHASTDTTAGYAAWSKQAGARHVEQLDSFLDVAS